MRTVRDFVAALRDFRILPLVLIAAGALLLLKSLGLLIDGGYLFAPAADDEIVTYPQPPKDTADPEPVGSIETAPAEKPASRPSATEIRVTTAPSAPSPRLSWAQEMFNFPDVTGAVSGNRGQSPSPTPARPDRGPDAQAEPAQQAARTTAALPERSEARLPSAAERAILERLQERRRELEARARELDMREALVKAEEKRLEARVAELKEIEERLGGNGERKDEAEAARFKSLVTMYENMKAKDAARIFDRLDLKILIEVAAQINPRRMADILAQMSPEAAERLTVAFAGRASGKTAQAAELPKIVGRPSEP